MSSYERIPQELKDLDQWVGANESSKVPLEIVTFKNASSTAPSTWCSFNTALEYYEHGFYDHLGFVFNNNGIVGIDIDQGYEDGLISQLACDIIEMCKSYTERSKSGRGFHILVKGTLPFTGKNNREGVEIYQGSRFFIMTGQTVMYDKLIENQEAIDCIIDTFFSSMRISEGASHPKIYEPIWEKVDGRFPLRPTYPPILEGSRNICLTSLAGSLHTQGFSPDEIWKELDKCNSVACTPPLDSDEVRNIVASVTRYRRE